MIIPAKSLKYLMPDHAPIEVNGVFAIRFDGSKTGLCTVVVFIAFFLVCETATHPCMCFARFVPFSPMVCSSDVSGSVLMIREKGLLGKMSAERTFWLIHLSFKTNVFLLNSSYQSTLKISGDTDSNMYTYISVCIYKRTKCVYTWGKIIRSIKNCLYI